MAIALNTPKGEGYNACCLGKQRESNPYWSIQGLYNWYEWDAGWGHAFDENKFGVES